MVEIRKNTARKSSSTSARGAKSRLLEYFQRNGYMRFPNMKQRKNNPNYKKGHEVRLVLYSREELDEVISLLELVGLSGGRPFQKNQQVVQPIYGKDAVDAFLEWNRVATKASKKRKR
jgi:hypothetical protein